MKDIKDLDTTPLIELAAPLSPIVEEPAAAPAVPEEDEEGETFEEAILVQPVDDLNETFEVVQGPEGAGAEGDILTTEQIASLRKAGYTVIEQSILESTYHVHAEVSPRGIPLTHNHRIPINAKSEAEAKSKARKHAKERGWKIHNISKVTLAEDAGTLELAPDLTEDDLSFIVDNITLEELELLDELSSEKLKSYVKKAKPEYEDAWLQMKNKLAQKRGQGVDRAEEKLRKKKLVREIAEMGEMGELEDQTSNEPRTFSEITAEPIVEDALLEQRPEDLDESVGTKVFHFDQFKDNVQSHSDHTTTDGNVKYEHKLAKVGDKKWHQTIATVRDREGHNYIRGVFNHKHGKNSPHGHGWTSSPYGDDD